MFSCFYADPHFGHAKILDYEKRPFADVEEMNRELIARYNSMMGTVQTCLWAGDAFLMPFDEAKKVMDRLNGKKALLLGNHDRSAKRMAELGFTVVTGELVLYMGGRTVRVSHYPYWTGEADRHGRDKKLSPEEVEKYKALYPKRVKGEVLVHGHTHGKKRRHENMINIGVDAWDFRPVRWREVEDEVEMI